MKTTNKILSLVLVFVMLLSVFPFNTVYAVEGAETVETQNTEEFALPDIVPEEEAVERGYIGRVKEEEKDNYTFVFKDSENMRTMRVYSHPVKYTDKDGNTKDITLDIQSRAEGGFETKDNSIKTTFGAKLSDGIRLQSEDVDIKLIPANSLNRATLSEDSKTVSYTLDEKTTLEYSLTYTGFKEDIVVNEYTGQTEYEFLLYTNGLTVKEEMGSYYLADSEGNRKANIGDIIIFTADERNNTFGELSCEEIKPNYAYLLTIHVDAEYLKDEKTVYPIRIDPTLEVTGTGAIEDVTVYTGTSYYSGTSGILYIGRADDKVYRALMRFPGLELPVDFPEMITSAKIELRDVMCQGTQVPIICTPYPAIAAGWSESTTSTWNSTQQYYTSNKVLDEQVVYYGNGNVPGISQRYAFDITEEAKNWVSGSSTPDRGVVFRMSDSFAAQTPSTTEEELKYFGSYNRSDYQPSLTIEYRTDFTPVHQYYIARRSDGSMLKSTTSQEMFWQNYYLMERCQIWSFYEVSSGVYIISPIERPGEVLTASNANSTVYLSPRVEGAESQHWSFHYYSDGVALISESTNKHFYYGTDFVVNEDMYTAFGLFEASSWTPCASLTAPEQIVSVGSDTSIKGVTASPENATAISDNWLTFSSADENVCTIDENGYIDGVSIGSTTITITNKITKCSTSCIVYVCYPVIIDVYYDAAFNTVCTNDFSDTPSNKIQSWFADVRLKYAKDLNINLSLKRIRQFVSYPETVENGSMICTAGNDPYTLCDCGRCLNSNEISLKEYHHKNADNITYRLDSPESGINLNVYFSGHMTCWSTMAQHYTGQPMGGTLFANKVSIVFVNPQNINGTNEDKIKTTLAHEIGHNFYITDHNGNTDNGRSDYCIWGEYYDYSSVNSELKTCDYCTSVIKQNASRFYSAGG